MGFKDEFKAMRKKLLMSQHDIAKEIGVSYAPVNRWEQGAYMPTYKAQKAIREFCKRNNLDEINFED